MRWSCEPLKLLCARGVDAAAILQVVPAAAEPTVSRLSVAQTQAVAGPHNFNLRLQLADAYGNLATTGEHLSTSAELQAMSMQKTMETIKATPQPYQYSLDIEASVTSSAAGDSSLVEAEASQVTFEGTGSDTALVWSISLTAAGVHELSVLLGTIQVTGAPVNVTVGPSVLHPYACRVVGTSGVGSHTLTAGDSLQVRLLAGDRYQNAIIAPADLAESVAAAHAFVTNWAAGLTLGAYSDVAALPMEDSTHGALCHVCGEDYAANACKSTLHFSPAFVLVVAQGTILKAQQLVPRTASAAGS